MVNNTEGNCKPSVSADASSLLTQVTSFDFIVCLIISTNVLDTTLPVKQFLQGKSIDEMDGLLMITALKKDVANMRTNVDHFYRLWYKQTLKLSGKVNLEESRKRIVAKQTT